MSSQSIDELVIIQDDEYFPNKSSLPPWKILIADDDIDIHLATKLALDGFIFMDRELDIYNTYSAKETIQLLKKEKDIAAILLDVVMESDDAGLIVVKQIREQINNHDIRIILRTGQPGYAPEFDVIKNYDINDYKTKSELTQEKLLATITTALRSYDQIKELQETRNELKRLAMFPERNPNSVSQLNLQGDIVYTNPGSEKLLERYCNGSTDITSLFPDNLKQLLTELRETDRESLRHEYSRGNGTLNCQIQFLKDISVFNIYIEDITDNRRLEKQLAQSQKMEAVGQFTGGIAHDFNNILASVQGYTELAIERIKKMDDDKLKNYLSTVLVGVNRASDLPPVTSPPVKLDFVTIAYCNS